MAHTPGPWEVDEDEHPTVESDDGPIATGLGGLDPIADAYLIAASIDLLEACEAIIDRLDYLRNLWGDEGVTRSLCDQVRAAIARAKGGE